MGEKRTFKRGDILLLEDTRAKDKKPEIFRILKENLYLYHFKFVGFLNDSVTLP